MAGATIDLWVTGRPLDAVRPRPAILRALGADDPPAEVEIDGESFRRIEILKHDSWAATAVYRSPTRRALCKFNRRHPVCGLPMRWLGRLLVARLLDGLFRVLARCDDYHLLKHRLRHRPDQVADAEADLDLARPAWIRAHRRVAVPFRECRRRLLVWLGVRAASGQAESEFIPEVAHRPGTAADLDVVLMRRAA